MAENSEIPRDKSAEYVDIGGLIGIVWRGKWTIVAAGLLAAIIGIGIAVTATPVYTSSATVIIEPQGPNIGNGGPIDIRGSLNESVVESKIQIVLSNRVLRQVVEDLDLVNDPEFGVTDDEMAELAAELGFPRDSEVAQDIGWRTALKNLSEALDVRQRGLSFVITIAASSEDPRKSAKLANSVAEAFVAVEQAAKIDAASDAAALLVGRLSFLNDAAQRSTREFEEFRVANSSALEQEPMELSLQLDRLENRLSKVREQIEEISGPQKTALEQERDVLDMNIANVRERQAQLTAAKVKLVELERTALVDQEIYTSILERARQLGELQEAQLPDVRVISDALPPLQPSFPNKKLIVVLAGFIGGLLGGLWVLGRGLLASDR